MCGPTKFVAVLESNDLINCEVLEAQALKEGQYRQHRITEPATLKQIGRTWSHGSIGLDTSHSSSPSLHICIADVKHLLVL